MLSILIKLFFVAASFVATKYEESKFFKTTNLPTTLQKAKHHAETEIPEFILLRKLQQKKSVLLPPPYSHWRF